mgnify:CR=1 FL=1
MKIKVCAYCRVSTDSKDQTNSYENQKSYFEREISKNPDYELVGIYADKGISGTKLQRPEFNCMLEDAGLDIKEISNDNNDQRKQYLRYITIPSTSRKPKFNLILTKNTSRFARNTNVGEILDNLKSNNVYVQFLDLNKSTKNESDITVIKLFQVFDENDSRDKSVKVRFGQTEGTKHGIIHTSSKLYGYKYIKTENRLEVIPEEAEVIKTIYNLYVEGLGIRQIINTLTDSGIRTRQGKNFCKSTIRRILDNEKYAGKNNSMKYDTGIVFNKNSYPKIKDKYMIENSNKIPAIISWNLFQRCKELLKNKINYTNQKGIYKGKSKYSGLIHCGFCGSIYYANQDNGRKFYNCANKKAHGLSVCQSPNISETFVDEIVERSANQWIYEELQKVKAYARDVIFNIIRLKIKQLNNQDNSKTQELNTEINATKTELKNYYSLFARESVSKEIITNQIHDTEIKLQKLQNEYNETTKTKDQLIQDIHDLSDYHFKIESMYSDESTNTTKRHFSLDEALPIISRIDIIPEDKKDYSDGWSFSVSYKVCVEIANMVKQYKQSIDFHPLSKDELITIYNQILTII